MNRTWLIRSYILLFVSFHLLLLTPLSWWWPVHLLNTFGLWLYLPFLILLPFTPWKDKATRYLLLIPLTIFVVEYGPQFWPNMTKASPSDSIRVMTWNIHYRTTDAAAIRQDIVAQQPDIVAIQELGTAMAAPLAIALQTDYPYQALAPVNQPDEFAVFSRYPIERIENNGRGNPDCICQTMTVQVKEQSINLINVHLPLPQLGLSRIGPLPIATGFNANRQTGKLRSLLQRIQTSQGPVIALGDFNLSDRQPNYLQLRQVAHDAFRNSGWGFGLTYPATPQVGLFPWFSLVRIDYVWYNRGPSSTAAWVGKGAIADHRFLVADLNLS